MARENSNEIKTGINAGSVRKTEGRLSDPFNSLNNINTSKQFAYISALLAFILWGGWAFYVNGEFGNKARVFSGITQGIFSFIVTLLMTKAIAYQYNKFSSTIFKILLPPIVTVSITGTLLVLIHSKVGTPEILKTVSPALTVALLFSFFTVYKLHLASTKLRKGLDSNDTR